MELDRRSLLGLAALGLGNELSRGLWPARARLAMGAAHAGGMNSSRSELTFEEFLEEAGPGARELVADTSRIGEDRYLHALASHAVRLRDVPVPQLRENTAKGDRAKTWIGANDPPESIEEVPFTVLHWKLEPHAVIHQHPHLYGSVVTLCLEGEIRVRNYECVDAHDFDTKDAFRVRQVTDQVLQPGGINLVPLTHGYTHGFVAGPQGARGLDITTRTRDRRSTPNLEVSPQPLEPGGAIYEGRWIYR